MKKSLSLLMCIFIFIALKAQPLISYQSSWKYLDNGSNQGTSWRSTSFNDASWKTGNGKFGYGITDAATIISFGSNANKKFITTYFRKAITISSIASSSYTVDIKRDDGVIVYLNGSEVYRNNLPTGTISSTTLASEATDNGSTPQTFTISPAAFAIGTNLIAVEVHQAKANTPDMAFDLELIPPTNQPPSVISINRQSPVNSSTNAASVTFRAIFSKKVNGVDRTDFSLIPVSGNVTGTLSSNVTPVGTDGTTYDVTVNSITGNGTLRLDLNSSGTGITDVTGTAITGGFVGGQTYTIDQTAPVVASINRQSPATTLTNASSLTYRITFSEKVRLVDYTDFSLMQVSGAATGTINSNGIVATGTDSASYDVTVSSVSGSGTLRLDLKSTGTGITDAAGNAISVGYTSGQTYTVDKIVPALSPVSIASNNSNPSIARVGDVTTLAFTASETINAPAVTIAAHSVTATAGSGNNFTVTYAMTSSDAEGTVPFTINFTDVAGNTGTQVTSTTNGSSVLFNKGAPAVLSINRQSPSVVNTNASSVTFRVTFSKKVTGVDRADFSIVTVSGNVTGTIGNKAVTSVGTDGTTYDVTVSSITGNGTLRLDLKSSGTGIIDVNGNAITGGYTSGQTFIIDKIVPAVTSINRQSPLAATTNAISLTYRVTFSEKVRQVDYTDFTITKVSGTVTSIISSNAIVVTGIDSASYDVTVSSVSGSGTLRLDLKSSNTGIIDVAGNAISGGFTSGQTYTVDQARPTLPFVSISSNNNNPANAKAGDIITLAFTASEPVNIPVVTIATHSVPVTQGSNNSFTATYTITNSDAETIVPFTINFTDITGNAGTQVTTTSNGSSVLFDKTVPVTMSIKRQVPTTDTTNATSVTFRAVFSEGVTGVDVADFSPSTTGATTAVVVSVAAVNATTYDISVDSINGNGTLKLDLNSASTGIKDLSGNVITNGFITGEAYIIESTSSFATALNYLPISTNTGEKPQSKVWNYNGYYWAVLPNSTGTYLWRLDGTNWTNVLKLSDSTNSHADCKRVGNITHILLFQGFQGLSAQLVSVEYVSATNTYQLWSARPSTVSITLDPGVETGVIDIDGRGRMWLASAGQSDINVRWSDAPYSSWSSRITIASGVADDDICDVIYMPTAGKIGVLWSNQNTKRFGFKTHIEGAIPSTWSAEEVPASQSAINFGSGMADDHLNVALGSDGTLYCAVKTSYDATGYPKVSLLVRRPTGVWDSLYEVSQTGTRGIAILNESLGKLKVIYTSSETGGDILCKETSISDISFSSPITLLQGTYNNATSTKENYNSDIVILAGDTVHLRAAGVLLTDIHSTSVPTVPILIAPSNVTSIVMVPADLKWSAAAGAASYQVQVSTVFDFTSIVFEQSNVTGTSIQVTALTNSTVYYWRVRAANTLGNSDWSPVWSFITSSGGPLVAHWKMEEGSGTTVTDSSEFHNTGTTFGNPQWVAGRVGQALQLNGSSQYATVPNSQSLNVTTAVSLMAWIKPEKVATQYVIKKASLNSTDGYELSLSTNGRVFFRINQDSSENTYRVNSLTPYPVTGSKWMHVAATFDGSIIKIYINGVLDSSFTFNTPVQIISNNLELGIGAGPNGGSKLQGSIDDARIYNKALSASEIFDIVAQAPPTIPSLAAPANSSLVANPATLSWYAATSATASSYQVQVSLSSDFASTVFDQTNITDTSIHVSGLANSTIHYWRVRATNGVENSGWSQVWSFTTGSGNPLVAHWKMDEGSGTILADASEYQNNATTVGNPVWITGKIGQALQLDGSSQYATVPNNSSLNPATAITLMAWIKPERLATQYVIKKAILNVRDGYELALSQSGQVFFRINEKTSLNTYRVNSLTLYPTDGNTWMHIAATFDGSVLKLYINGNLEKSLVPDTLVAISTNTSLLGIGAQSDGVGIFQGDIDDERIYNTALSASEIFNVIAETTPAIPVLITPSNAATGVVVNPANLSWSTTAGATSYEVQISTVADFSSTIFDQSNITDTLVQTTGLANNTIHYWRVKAINGAGNSNWSQIWSFTTASNNPLVAQWKMDEGSGNILTDASEYHNNGTTVGSPVWVTGKIGQALRLDGNSQYVTVSNNPSLSPTTAITLAAWIKPEKLATQYVIKKAILGVKDGYELTLSQSGQVFFRMNEKTSLNTYRVNSLTLYPTDGNTWMHIAATFDGFVLKLYINGNLEKSLTLDTSVAISANTSVLGIGAQSDGTSMFKGAIDDERIYNVALSNAEILNIIVESPPIAPVLTGPSNEATAIMINPSDLSWNGVTGAASYEGQVSTSPDFTSIVVDQTNITDTLTQVSGLVNSTIYYWRVRAINGVGSSDWSQVWSFTTASNNPLVAQWKMDEGSGTNLTDASEYGNNGTTVGSPVWVTGKIGQALQLDGNTQYAAISNSASLNPTTAITLSAWIKPEQLGTQYILKKAINSNTDGYELSLSSSGKVFFRINQKTSGDTYRINSLGSYPTDGNTWMHVAATYDGAVLKLYINGVEDASLTLINPPAINTNSLIIGIGAQPDGQSKFKGSIDDARIYNIALNPSDILNIVAEATPVAPRLVGPANSSIGITINPLTLTWNTVATASSYKVQVSITPDFSSTVFDQSSISTTSVSVPGLNNYSVYYWRVRANNTIGNGDWSTVWGFRTISNAALVGYWQMDEASGTTISDASEYGNNGKTIGSPVWVIGKIGLALQLNGSQYDTVPNNPSLNPTTGITLSAWIKPELFGTQNIIKKAVSGVTDGYELSLSSTGKVFFRINQKTSGDTYRINSSTSYPTDGNTWMHVAATYDGTALRIYINGVENASLILSGPAINTNNLVLAIGAQSDSQSKFKGAIDEARVYNTALSASEIANLATVAAAAQTISSAFMTLFRTDTNAELLAYPNPFSSKTTIRFVLPINSNYSLGLYDLNGRQITLLKEGRAIANALNIVEVTNLKLSKGIYIVKLQTSQYVKTQKLLALD
jgi:hypothetical protein